MFHFCLFPFSYTLLKMEMSGLLHQITSNWVNNTDTDDGSNDFHSLGYQDTFFPFLVMLGGCVLTLGLILIEPMVKGRKEDNESCPNRWADRIEVHGSQ